MIEPTSPSTPPFPRNPAGNKMHGRKRYTVTGMLGLLAFFFFLMYGLFVAMLHSPVFDQVVLAPFRPDALAYTNAIKNSAYKGEDHFFVTPDGCRLHAWLFRKPGAEQFALFHHGNSGNISNRMVSVDCLLDSGANVFVYDYRGFGKSTGTPHIRDLTTDGLAAYDYLTNKLHIDKKQIVNYGESIGTGVASQIALQRPSSGLILQSAIGSLPLMGHKHFGVIHFGPLKGWPLLDLVPDFLFPDPKLDNIASIKSVHVPVLLLHGQKDEMAPYQHSEMIYAAANEPKRLVPLPDCGHNEIEPDRIQFTEALSTFLQKSEKSPLP